MHIRRGATARSACGRVCDLYGRRGFDVLAVTDHATRIGSEVTADLYDAYLAEVEDEAERARSLYDLLVLPGSEADVRRSGSNPGRPRRRRRLARLRRSCRRVARICAHRCASPGGGARCRPPVFARRARRCDARDGRVRSAHRRAGATRRPIRALQPAHAVRLGGRRRLAGGCHRRLSPAEPPPHLEDALPCAKDGETVVDYLRSQRPAFLVSLDEAAPARAA